MSDGVRDTVQAIVPQGDPFLAYYLLMYLVMFLKPVNKEEETVQQVTWEPEEII